jgi:O-succinylbenzoic acid--CoA ligase
MTRTLCPLAAAARQYGSEQAVLDDDTCLTYGQLDQIVQSVSAMLRRDDVGPGHRVGIQASNSWRLLASLWALFRLQATACLFSPRWPTSAVDAARDQLSVGTFLDEIALANLVRESSIGAPLGEDDRFVDDRALATIVFSSGSTSQPKAIAHDLLAHRVSASGSNENLPVHVGDRWLLALPLYHVSGLGIVFRCCLAGAQVVLPRAEEPISEAIRRLQATHLSLVPTQLKQLRHESVNPPASLRAVLLGGSSWPVETVRGAVENHWPVLTTYGLSEMASQVTTTGPSTSGEQLGTSGRTLAGRELKVADTGEILVRGDTLFRGYVSGSELRCPLDSAGWFHTGDLGRLDGEGNLTVVGRMDNMFVSGGENIYPEEIEARLLEIDAVRQAVVVAVPDAQFGWRPVAWIDAEDLQPDEWRERLEAYLPRFKLPDRFLPWPHEHVSEGIKVDRRRMAELALEQ